MTKILKNDNITQNYYLVIILFISKLFCIMYSMRKIFYNLCFVVMVSLFCIDIVYADSNDVIYPLSEIDTSAKYVVAIDGSTKQIIFQKNATERMMPASMSKLMTLYTTFEAIEKGSIKLDDYFTVSKKAYSRGGSSMFLQIGEKIKVIDLIKGSIIVSGNDASIALAEGISGSEDLFVQNMNDIAKKLGMKNSHFVNSTGWPVLGHEMSALDIATISQEIYKRFPQYNYIYNQKSLTHNSIYQPNTNNMLKYDIGVNGMKTGSSNDTGCGISLSVSNPENNRDIFLVAHGFATKAERDLECKKLIHYAMNMFGNKTIYKKGDVVFDIDIINGKSKNITTYVEEDINIIYPIHDDKVPKINLNYVNKIPAPIRKGDYLGSLTIEYSPQNIEKKDFYSNVDIDRANFIVRMFNKLFANN